MRRKRAKKSARKAGPRHDPWADVEGNVNVGVGAAGPFQGGESHRKGCEQQFVECLRLESRQEGLRRDNRRLPIAQARQNFRPNYHSGLEVNDRLVVVDHLTGGQHASVGAGIMCHV